LKYNNMWIVMWSELVFRLNIVV